MLQGLLQWDIGQGTWVVTGLQMRTLDAHRKFGWMDPKWFSPVQLIRYVTREELEVPKKRDIWTMLARICIFSLEAMVYTWLLFLRRLRGCAGVEDRIPAREGGTDDDEEP